MAYTLYGMIITQFGEIEDVMTDQNVSVKQFLKDYFGFEKGQLGLVAGMVVGFVALFTFIFAFSIRTFNFQRR